MIPPTPRIIRYRSTNSSISGLTTIPIWYVTGGYFQPEILGGTGQNIYNVLSTPNAGPDPITTTTIVGNGPATVNIGKTAAQGVLGDLIIQNPSYATAIAADDSADQQGRNVTLSEQSLPGLISLTGLTPATVYYLGSA